MILDNYNQLADLRSLYERDAIVFCSGSFDLIHPGHGLFFEDCKKHGDILVVQVGCDASIRKYKGGNRPIYNQDVRLKAVDLMKPVDYCILEEEICEGGAEEYLFPLLPAFEKLKPDCWIFNSEASEIESRRELAQRFGIEIIVLERTSPKEFENISTTQIIKKIRDLD